MTNINFNGRLFAEQETILNASNRAFRYGDGLFETIRVFEGKMPFFDRHWQRLSTGMQFLKFELPTQYSPAFFQNEIAKLTESQGNWRVRLTVFRSGGGFYTPEKNGPDFLAEVSPMPTANFELNKRGLKVGIFQDFQISAIQPSSHPAIQPSSHPAIQPSNHPAIQPSSHPAIQPSNHPTFQPSIQPQNLKTCNALPFVLAGIYKQEKGWDDCLLMNTAGRIACGGSSNIFFVKNAKLITPSLSEGCIAGTMRAEVLDLSKKLGIEALEAPIGVEDMAGADELFLTNAIQGVRWVGEIADVHKTYTCALAETIIAHLKP